MVKNDKPEPANDAVANRVDGTPKRRIQDSITSKDPRHKLNLDRRVKNSDRRKNDDPNYKGPSRRYTIDRRVNIKDRRKSD